MLLVDGAGESAPKSVPVTVRETMMPLAPMPVIPVPTKPKMGFTIESLVGKWPMTATASSSSSAAAAAAAADNDSRSSNSPVVSRPSSSLSGVGESGDRDSPMGGRLPSTTATFCGPSSSSSPPPPQRPRPSSPTLHVPTASMAAAAAAAAASSSASSFMHEALKGIYAPEPTYSNGGLLMGHHPHHHHHHPHHPHHPHHHHHVQQQHMQQQQQQQQHVHHHHQLPLHAHMSHQLQSGFPAAAAAAALSPLFLGNIGTVGPHPLHRDAYPLYPWLLSRQGRFIGHRFQGPDAPAFLLQPFRKPKRIRTAFSPSQLLKLEHAFEKNHYVVGAERKHLAQTLSLTETQVKVWFQNRRTKHKRIKQEEEQTQSSPPSPKKKGTHHLNKWKMETQQSGEENSSEAS